MVIWLCNTYTQFIIYYIIYTEFVYSIFDIQYFSVLLAHKQLLVIWFYIFCIRCSIFRIVCTPSTVFSTSNQKGCIKFGCFYLKYRFDLQLLYTYWNQSGLHLEANIGRFIMHLVQTVFGFVHLAKDISDKFSFQPSWWTSPPQNNFCFKIFHAIE